MEQKRTLTGEDEANGHDSGSGTIRNSSRKKNRHLVVWVPQNRSIRRPEKTRIIRPLCIPEAFIPKPVAPVKCYRTGKVWSSNHKRPPFRPIVFKSSSDSQLLLNRPSSLRRSSSLTNVSSVFSLHSVSSRFQVWLDVTATRRSVVPCSHCLADSKLIAQGSLPSDRSLHSLLGHDFLPTSVFQHLLFWM